MTPGRSWLTSRRRSALVALTVLIVYAGFTSWFMAPALVDCNNTVMGMQPGDATAGGVWLAWIYHTLPVSPFTTTTPMVGAPGLGQLWRPQFVTAEVWLLPYWVAAKVLSPVCTWNLGILSGFILDGMAMFGFIRWLTRRPLVAFLAGYAYTFTPYHIEKSYGHFAYLHTWIFPLILWSLVALLRRPSRRGALVCGATMAIAGYTDGYFLLLVPVMAASFSAAALGAGRSAGLAALRAQLAAVATAAAAALMLLVPVVTTLITTHDQIASAVTRPLTELRTFSARPLEYLLPSHNHPLFGSAVTSYLGQHLHGSNYSEQTLYLGTAVLASAIAFLVIVIRRRDGWEAPDQLPLRRLAIALAATTLVALVFSAPPTVAGIPMPSSLVYRAVPFWRVYARFFLVADLAVVTLAALSWTAIAQRRLGNRLLLALFPVLVFDLLAQPASAAWSYTTATPEAYRWLAQRPGSPIVAEYPLLAAPDQANEAYLTFQVAHGKRLINDPPPGSGLAGVEDGIFDLNDPQTLPALRAIGVRYLLVHRDLFPRRSAVGGLNSPGLLLVHTSGPVDVYQIDGGPLIDDVLTLGGGFSFAEPDWPHSVRWMVGPGDLHIDTIPGRDGGARFEVSFVTSPFGPPRRLTVSQAGQVVWSGQVNGPTPVSFQVRSRAPIHLDSSPGPVCVNTLTRGTTDDRCLTIRVYGLSLEPVGWAAQAPGSSV